MAGCERASHGRSRCIRSRAISSAHRCEHSVESSETSSPLAVVVSRAHRRRATDHRRRLHHYEPAAPRWMRCVDASYTVRHSFAPASRWNFIDFLARISPPFPVGPSPFRATFVTGGRTQGGRCIWPERASAHLEGRGRARRLPLQRLSSSLWTYWLLARVAN